MATKKYTFEQHQELGKELFLMREKLLQISSDLSRVYNRKVSDLAADAYNVIDELRNQLDTKVFEEYPEFTTQDLADTYYCANRLRKQQPDPQA